MRGTKETRPCATCGQPLTRLVSQAKGELWFCNHACQIARMPAPASIGKQPNPYRGQQLTKACDQCGKPVTRYLTPERREKAWFCSYACRGKWQMQERFENGTYVRGTKPRTGDTFPCKVCGQAFYRQPAYIKQGRELCSRECNKAWQARNQTTKTCPQCGTIFAVRPSEVHITHCSHGCMSNAKIKRPTGRIHNGRPVIMNHHGYLTVYEPTHPAANRIGRVLEHRVVVEQILGRYLATEEQINHKNHDKADNSPENLEILSPSDHGKETNAYRMAVEGTLRAERDAALARMAAYEAKYGSLVE